MYSALNRVQSAVDDELKKLGRLHLDEAKSAGACRKAGFDNISVDLMYGIEGRHLKASGIVFRKS